MAEEKDTSVRVAVRIRPQSAKEKIDACRVCTFVTPGETQIAIGKDKRFTYDSVFDIPTRQADIYEKCVKRLVEGCFEGYNATVLAYGQTGAGKTYTMGTGFDISKCEEEFGVIPRAVDHLFKGIAARKAKAVENGLPEPEFIVSAQFMELYNEEIIDLFDTSRGAQRTTKIQIHGDSSGNIYAVGVTTKTVSTGEELMTCLQEGALNRTTASTRMNAQSSRSHAIFTIHMKQTRAVPLKLDRDSPTSEDGEDKENKEETETVDSNGPLEFESLSAKFHFTDLAGSERLKRTGATGDRAKEGIAINCGLLALGNVISALGDPAKAGSHVPYRDSKLTRLLQDSLGGNSQTLMIACVSPSDGDFMETVNTLTYANRARNIQNKVVLNQDKASQQLQALRQQIVSLQMELTEFKTGKRVAGEECYNDMYQENTMLKEENEHLRMRVKAMQEKSDVQTGELTKLKAQQVCGTLKAGGDGEGEGLETIIENYIKENESLRSKLLESEALCANLRRRSTSLSCAPMSPYASRVTPTPVPMAGFTVFESPPSSLGMPVLDLAKKDVEELRQKKLNLENQRIKNKENEGAVEQNGDILEEEEEGESDDEGEDSDDEEPELNLSDSDDDDEDEQMKDKKKDAEEDDNVQDELAALTFEIDTKQNLIDELEAQKKRMDSLRHQYENKLQLLEVKIKNTEEERDKILSNLESRSQSQKSTGEETTKIRQQYEKKLDNMKKELGKLRDAKKTHDRTLKDQTKYQEQLKKLKSELGQMKSVKVKLMKEMKEQQKKGKQQDTQRLREITQLRKEGRKKESQIRTLETKNQAKDRLVQRKREEIEMLKKQMAVKFGGERRKMALKGAKEKRDERAGKVSKEIKHSRSRSSEYSSKMAKVKWQKMEKKISNIVTQREMIAHLEKQMDRLMKQREASQKDMQRVERRKTKIKAHGDQVPTEMKTEISTLNETVEFTNYQIEEIQSEILQVTENMESDSFMSSLLGTCTVSEYRYILDHILTMVINKSAMVLVSQNKIAELTARLEGELETSKQAQELMRYIVEEKPQLGPEITELIKTPDVDEDSDSDSSPERPPSTNGFANDRDYTKVKARRRTATPHELLGMTPSDVRSKSRLVPEKILSPILASGDQVKTNGGLNETYVLADDIAESTPNEDVTNRRQTFTLPEPPSTLPLNSTQVVNPSSPARSPDNSGARPKIWGHTENGHAQNDGVLPSTPPSTKPQNKNMPHDVFARLTEKFSLASPRVNRGRMKECSSKVGTPRSNSHLECVQIAEGHNKPVLSLHAIEHLLFSASKDRTAKIWNLVTGQEFETLDGHPNNVNVVRRCPSTGLVYTVSLCYIKVWDIRTKAKCIKVISSSGQSHSPSSFLGTMARTNRMPDNEAQITDLALSRNSKLLYAAAGNVVRIWDLNKFATVGKLVGHVGPVFTLTVPDVKHEMVITGSKDHYVKSFKIPDTLGNISPTMTFNPPHMDGVESLATSTTHNVLFSGSRDKSIKKWDLDSKAVLKSEYPAHSSWVCTMDVVKFGREEMLVSGGRDGTVKVWDIDNLSVLDDIKAHGDTINDIASNKEFIYTASNDTTVKVWKAR